MYIPYDILIIVAFLLLGYGFGQLAEKRHYKSIVKREDSLKDILIFTSKSPPEDWQIESSDLVQGSVVVSVDYFKRFLFSLRNIFGGRVEAYESLIDRGRREAVLRMKQQALASQSNWVFNVKFETSAVSRGVSSALGSIEVYAYGTAIRTQNTSSSQFPD